MGIPLRPVERVEILALQDNYIDMTAADNNAVVTRANPLKEGAFRASIMAEHGLSALIAVSRAGKHICYSISVSPNMVPPKMP